MRLLKINTEWLDRDSDRFWEIYPKSKKTSSDMNGKACHEFVTFSHSEKKRTIKGLRDAGYKIFTEQSYFNQDLKPVTGCLVEKDGVRYLAIN